MLKFSTLRPKSHTVLLIFSVDLHNPQLYTKKDNILQVFNNPIRPP